MIESLPELWSLWLEFISLKEGKHIPVFALGHLSHFAGFVCSFPESINEGTGKGRSYVKNLNMNGEFIDVVGNMV